MRKLMIALTVLFMPLICGGVSAEVYLTVYNDDLGLVREIRNIGIEKGTTMINFDDVASRIIPQSVSFRCLDDNSAKILEQNFAYDLVSTEALLNRFLGKNITLVGEDDRRYSGELLSADGKSLILRSADGEVAVVATAKVVDYKFPSLPEGLYIKPSLRWLLNADSQGNRRCEVSYLTNGIGWSADYVAVVSDDDNFITLSGWVTINNQCGSSFKEATLKLVAGDIHRLPAAKGIPDYEVMRKADMLMGAAFAEEQLFEYHLYTLERKATINDREMKQLSLFSPTRTKAQKVFIADAVGYYRKGNDDRVKIKTNLEFENSTKAGLGLPLPKGAIRVYKADSKGALQFIGEDMIDHTPKDEMVRVYLGDAFDITGSRKLVNREDLGAQGYYFRETYEIGLKNHKKEAIVVKVVEHPQGWREWKIVKSSLPFRKIDNYRIEFEVNVPAEGEATLSYSIQYN